MSDHLPPARRVHTPLGDASTNMEGYVHAESQALKLTQDVLDAVDEHEALDPAFAEGWHAAISSVRVRLSEVPDGAMVCPECSEPAGVCECKTIDDLAEALRSASELIGRFESLLARLRYCDAAVIVAAEHAESAFLPLGVAAERLRATCAEWLEEHP